MTRTILSIIAACLIAGPAVGQTKIPLWSKVGEPADPNFRCVTPPKLERNGIWITCKAVTRDGKKAKYSWLTSPRGIPLTLDKDGKPKNGLEFYAGGACTQWINGQMAHCDLPSWWTAR